MNAPNKTIAFNNALFDRIDFRNLSLKSQKLLLMPLGQVFWGANQEKAHRSKFVVSLSKKYIEDILGVHSNEKHINSNIREWYLDLWLEANGYDKSQKKDLTEKQINSLYKAFEIKRFTKTEVEIEILDPAMFTSLQESKKGFTKLDTKAVMGFENKWSLLLYLAICKHWDRKSNKPTQEISLTTISLKKVLGMDIFDYCKISKDIDKVNRSFLHEYAVNCTNRYYINTDEEIRENKLSWINNSPKADTKPETPSRLSFKTIEEMDTHFSKLIDKVHFDRFNFEKKVIIPTLNELTNSGMITFVEQESLSRAKKGEKAEKVKRLFSKVYPIVAKDDKEQNKCDNNKKFDFTHVSSYKFICQKLL